MLVPAHYAYAAQVTLAWDPNTEPDLAGYTIYYGNAGSAYEYSVNVGNQTEYTLAELEDGMTYYFAVKARDIHGKESAYSNELSWPSPLYNEPRVEAGEITIDHNWAYVPFDQPFSDPIVVAKVMTYNDSAPCVVRICNIDGAGFEIRIQEWDYLNGLHAVESVSYIAMERGSYTLSNGTMVEAGQFQIQNAGFFQSVTFNDAFQVTPVVVASVSSFDEEDAPTGRLRNICTKGFAFMLQEQELNAKRHTPETISYIAWEPSVGTLGELSFEVNRTGDVMTQYFKEIVFEENFTELPAFCADMQTTDGVDTASVRAQGRDFFNVQVKIEEEQSANSEISHTNEVVGYMVFGASD